MNSSASAKRAGMSIRRDLMCQNALRKLKKRRMKMPKYKNCVSGCFKKNKKEKKEDAKIQKIPLPGIEPGSPG